MFRRVVRNSGRRVFCNGQKKNVAFRVFSTFAAANKDVLSVAGGLVAMGTIGAFIVSDISVLHRDIEKIDTIVREPPTE